MLWLPHSGQLRLVTNSGIVGGLPGTAVTSGGSADTFGTVTELISSAANDQDSWGIGICVLADGSPSGIATQAAIDILIGGATDDVLISSLLIGGANRAPSIKYFFPLHIPQGKRLACRISSTVVSKPYHVLAYLHGGQDPPFRVGRKVTTYGTKIDNSRGVAVTPAASGGAASVTEIVASTSEDHFCVMPGFQTATDISVTTSQMNIGIGIGASTEERVGTWWYGFSSSEETIGPWPDTPAFKSIPSGSRLTILASNSTANDAAYDGLIYAVS